MTDNGSIDYFSISRRRTIANHISILYVNQHDKASRYEKGDIFFAVVNAALSLNRAERATFLVIFSRFLFHVPVLRFYLKRHIYYSIYSADKKAIKISNY